MSEPTTPIELGAWREALRLAQLAATTKLVCHAVAHYARPDGGIVRLAICDLARDCSLSPVTAGQHLRRAERAGFVEISQPRKRVVAVRPRLPSPPSIRLEARDPRWAAWANHLISVDRDSERIGKLYRARMPLEVEADWPPPSDDVLETPDLSRATVPWGTPEFSAWLAHWRLTGRAVHAQAADVAQCTLFVESRWPPLPAPGSWSAV